MGLLRGDPTCSPPVRPRRKRSFNRVTNLEDLYIHRGGELVGGQTQRGKQGELMSWI